MIIASGAASRSDRNRDSVFCSSFVWRVRAAACLLSRCADRLQLNEYCHFAPQNFRHNRLKEKIYRTQIIAAEQMLFALVTREKKDRSAARSRPVADQLSGFETVHIGHLDVEKNRCEFTLRQMP